MKINLNKSISSENKKAKNKHKLFLNLFRNCLKFRSVTDIQGCSPSAESQAHLFMKGCDQPEIDIDAGASLLCPDELQNIVMLHSR